MGISRSLRALALVALSLGLFLAHPAYPARAAESITSFSTQVTVDKAGKADFSESIGYSFDTQRHGIYRDIPVVGSLPDNKYLYYDFALGSVTRDGTSEPNTLTKQGSYQEVKIGSADKTIIGTHNYVIAYSLSPFVRHDPAGDYISINLTGNKWDVAITKPRATVVLPSDATTTQATCFTGVQGSTAHDCTATISGNHVFIQSTVDFAAGAGLTVDLVLPANSFTESAYLTPSDVAPADTNGTTSGGSGLVAALIWIAVILAAGTVTFLIIRKKFIVAHRRKQQTVVPYYDAPDKLLPGEVGYLTDDTADSVEITATLIHLATRGHLKLTAIAKKKLFGSKKTFELDRLESKDKLEGYESILLDAIFSAGPAVSIDDLKPTTLSTTVTAIKQDLRSRLAAKGFYANKERPLSPDNITPVGYQEWAKVEGLKLYLNVAEKDRINFAEAPERTPDHFSKLLPYAIALGVEKQWAQQFAAIDITPATHSWYSGSSNLNAIAFTSVLSNSFAPAVTASFAPPSSSGGAGGGFSGGGGGGGGGGSW